MPYEVVKRVEHVQHIVTPIRFVEERVEHQVVSVNRRQVQCAPYVQCMMLSFLFCSVWRRLLCHWV